MSQHLIGYFDDYRDAKHAFSSLVDKGFREEKISLIEARGNTGSRAAAVDLDDDFSSETAKGAIGGGVAGLFAGLGSLMIPGLDPVLVTGPLAVALGAAGIGASAGAFLGFLNEYGVPKDPDGENDERLKPDGATVIVEISRDEITVARDCLDACGAEEIADDRDFFGTSSNGEISLGRDANFDVTSPVDRSIRGNPSRSKPFPADTVLQRRASERPRTHFYPSISDVSVATSGLRAYDIEPFGTDRSEDRRLETEVEHPMTRPDHVRPVGASNETHRR